MEKTNSPEITRARIIFDPEPSNPGYYVRLTLDDGQVTDHQIDNIADFRDSVESLAHEWGLLLPSDLELEVR